ncbi:unnamed protein product [Allacma fusca]|uniref:Dihydropteridine reductase n=1 Tax=Allacma fusca TaxID=39272 RepID=A0A8J2JP55_9HEXA|nr:unnamed protein product [Allacma fusca]
MQFLLKLLIVNFLGYLALVAGKHGHKPQTICLTADKSDCIVSPAGNVLIYGGSGIFGSFLVDFFHDHQYFVTNVDFKKNEDADLNVLLHSNLTFEQQAFIVANAIPDKIRFNAIICTKSGWTDKEGTLGSRDFLRNAQQVFKENLWSSLIAANLAPAYLNENGVLILMGGQLALKPMPSMIAYGVAKAAVHQLARSVGADGSGLPRGAKAYAILPASLTKGLQKKKITPNDIWSPLKDLARTIFSWIDNRNFAPPSGSLVQFLMSDDKTDIVIST